jgi:hypothetical protein
MPSQAERDKKRKADKLRQKQSDKAGKKTKSTRERGQEAWRQAGVERAARIAAKEAENNANSEEENDDSEGSAAIEEETEKAEPKSKAKKKPSRSTKPTARPRDLTLEDAFSLTSLPTAMVGATSFCPKSHTKNLPILYAGGSSSFDRATFILKFGLLPIFSLHKDADVDDDAIEELLLTVLPGQKKNNAHFIIRQFYGSQCRASTLVRKLFLQGNAVNTDSDHTIKFPDKHTVDQNLAKKILELIYFPTAISAKSLFMQADGVTIVDNQSATQEFQMNWRSMDYLTDIAAQLLGTTADDKPTLLNIEDKSLLCKLLATILVVVINPPNVAEVISRFAHGLTQWSK